MMAAIHQLHFLRPEYLWLLPLIAGAFIALYLLRNKSSQWYDVIDPLLIEHLLDSKANQQASRRTSLPLLAAAMACCIAIIALAGPSWERLPSVSEQKNDAMIIIADLTLSMHATDIKPSRLIRTRYKLLELLKQRKAGQTALIAYSGDAHIVSPLTDDASTIAALIPSLTPEIMPSIGSNAIAAFNSATQLLKNSGISQAKIIWFTDEALRSDINKIDKVLNNSNNQLIIIGVGSKAGGPVPLPSGKFVKDTSGRIVNAPLSRDRLRKIAANSGGVYLDLQSDNSDINVILSESLFDQLASTENTAPTENTKNNFTDTWQDRGGYIALLLLPFALLAFRRGWMLSLVLAFNISHIHYADANSDAVATSDAVAYSDAVANSDDEQASEANSFKWLDLWQTPDQQAYALARQQQYSQAAKTFADPRWKGVTEYQAGDYQPALETLSALAKNNNSDAAHYNHGHALARNNQLDDAIAAYDKALAINPKMENAKQAKAIIEALKKQQEQQEQQDQGEKNNDEQQGDKQNEQQSEQKDSEQESSQSADNKNNSSSQESESRSEDSSQDDKESSNELLDRQAEQDESENKNKREEQQTQQNKQEDNEKADAEAKKNERSTTDMQTSEEQLNAEQQAELQQWLKKIPDDPGGLLRRKFQYERNVRERQGNVIDDREQGQLW